MGPCLEGVGLGLSPADCAGVEGGLCFSTLRGLSFAPHMRLGDVCSHPGYPSCRVDVYSVLEEPLQIPLCLSIPLAVHVPVCALTILGCDLSG